MDLEELSKHQIVLLTLLVSFVTSIATGIVTVSLLEQAPEGVTKTIHNVVERTVERVVAPNSSEDVVDEEALAAAVAKLQEEEPAATAEEADLSGIASQVSQGIVSLGDEEDRELGVITKDSEIIGIETSDPYPTLTLSTGEEVTVGEIEANYIGFTYYVLKNNEKFEAEGLSVVEGGGMLGEEVFSLVGGDTNHIKRGIVTATESGEEENYFTVSYNLSVHGTPVFARNGDVLGLYDSELGVVRSLVAAPLDAPEE